jgi:hypothetical protein
MGFRRHGRNMAATTGNRNLSARTSHILKELSFPPAPSGALRRQGAGPVAAADRGTGGKAQGSAIVNPGHVIAARNGIARQGFVSRVQELLRC